MSRCFYCNTKKEMFITGARPKNEKMRKFKYCCDNCVSKTDAFMDFADRTRATFWTGISFAALLCILGIVLSDFFHTIAMICLMISFFVLGLTIIFFPHATPEAFAILSIKKTLILAKILGTALVLSSPMWILL